MTDLSTDGFWLLKSEPDVYSFDHLLAEPQATASWDGVRNYQARNLMRDQMKIGHRGFFYHSRIADPAVVGMVEIVRAAYPDLSALDPKCPYYDAKSADKGESRWLMVDVKATHRMARPVPLSLLRSDSFFTDMPLLRRGQRLSIQPVKRKHWQRILDLGQPQPC